MKDIPNDVLDRFVDACHDVDRRGLLRCSCGNLSLRVDAERMLITATGSWMGRLAREQVVLCRIDDGAVLEGTKPSSEIGFHAGVLKARPDMNAVLHFQTPFATALACRATDGANYAVIPEIPFYVGAVKRVPYYPPGSADLAAAVTKAMRHHDMVMMANHGQVTVGRDLDHVIQNAEFFEFACQVVHINGAALTPLSPEAIEQIGAMRGAKAERRAV
jgi:ribulose-5-phosphate 4-epimerase/fuculose-1-phosphate aldolase